MMRPLIYKLKQLKTRNMLNFTHYEFQDRRGGGADQKKFPDRVIFFQIL